MKKSINEQIRKKILQDRFIKKIVREINKHFKMKIIKKLLLFQKLIYMLLITRKKMIQQHHNNVLTEYFEIDKIIKMISQNYYFLLMRQKMKKHIQ